MKRKVRRGSQSGCHGDGEMINKYRWRDQEKGRGSKREREKERGKEVKSNDIPENRASLSGEKR